MKFSIAYLSLCIIFFACSQKRDWFSDKDYISVGIDSSEGIVGSRVLINRYDTSRKLIILYWDNGNVISKGYYKGKLREGTNENFDIDGKIINQENYHNGIKNGHQKTYYSNGNLKVIEDYFNGKLTRIENFDSLGNKTEK